MNEQDNDHRKGNGEEEMQMVLRGGVGGLNQQTEYRADHSSS